MGSYLLSKFGKDNNLKSKFDNIKSNYFLLNLFGILPKNKLYKMIKYNKKLQNAMNLTLNDYKKFSEIEIDIIPISNKSGKFINLENRNDYQYFHIYFNDDFTNEIEETYLNKSHDIKKIKIIIERSVNSFDYLFLNCQCIESIVFRRFNRSNISSMKNMFDSCELLKELNLSNFNTNNVINMSVMFNRCSSLKELNLSNFNTKNVINMSFMFSQCASLKELNLSNFNTNKVTEMTGMFRQCTSLEKLNISNFNTSKVKEMRMMFWHCSSLKELNLSNFNTNNVIDMSYIFDGCSSLEELNISNFDLTNVISKNDLFRGTPNELKKKIRELYKNIEV